MNITVEIKKDLEEIEALITQCVSKSDTLSIEVVYKLRDKVDETSDRGGYIGSWFQSANFSPFEDITETCSIMGPPLWNEPGIYKLGIIFEEKETASHCIEENCRYYQNADNMFCSAHDNKHSLNETKELLRKRLNNMKNECITFLESEFSPPNTIEIKYINFDEDDNEEELTAYIDLVSVKKI